MVSAGRVMMLPKGEYNAATTYTVLDVVSYQGGSYVAKTTTTGHAPTDETYWQVTSEPIDGLSVVDGAVNITFTE